MTSKVIELELMHVDGDYQHHLPILLDEVAVDERATIRFHHVTGLIEIDIDGELYLLRPKVLIEATRKAFGHTHGWDLENAIRFAKGLPLT